MELRYIHTELDKLKAESTRWLKKSHVAYEKLEKLKKEINESNCAEILKFYQKVKDLEVRYSKQNIKLRHKLVFGIHSDLPNDSDKLLQKSNPESNADMQDKYKQLHHFVQTSTYLVQDNYKIDSDDEESDKQMLQSVKRSFVISEDEAPASTSTAKRQRQHPFKVENGFELDLNVIDDTDSDDYSGVFKRPAIIRENMDATHVLSHATDDDHNSNIDVNSIKSLAGKKENVLRKNLVSSILSERIARVPANRDRMKTVLLKSKNFSHHNLLKTVATGVQKENRKYSPVRIRKSPRSVIVNSLATTANIVKQQATRTIKNNGNAAIVRINRAASFRVKK